jgi:hypothetical protein
MWSSALVVVALAVAVGGIYQVRVLMAWPLH